MEFFKYDRILHLFTNAKGQSNKEAYSERCKTSIIERFVKIDNG